MESRNITLTLDKAIEWFNSGNEALREAALQAYTEKELTIPEWEKIKTFEDACNVLNISNIQLNLIFTGKEQNEHNHLNAILKLDIIRRALNKDWEPSLIKGRTYYPLIRFYPAGKETREAASRNN